MSTKQKAARPPLPSSVKFDCYNDNNLRKKFAPWYIRKYGAKKRLPDRVQLVVLTEEFIQRRLPEHSVDQAFVAGSKRSILFPPFCAWFKLQFDELPAFYVFSLPPTHISKALPS